MYTILISLASGIVIALGIKLLGFPLWAGIIPGVLALLVAFLLLARWVSKRVQVHTDAMQKQFDPQPTNQKELQQAVARALKDLEQALAYEKWQLTVGPGIHAQMGILKYMVKDLDGALVHFQQSTPSNALAKVLPQDPMAKALEGALHYQRKNYTAMESAFEAAVGYGKKDPVVWAAYAWCLLQIKERDKALRVLSRAVDANPSDEKLKASLTQVQNDKRLKMKPYEPGWWNFGLETPPPQAPVGGRGRRVQFINRR